MNMAPDKVRAWDAFTGAEKWSYDAKAPFFAGPASTGKIVYAADLEGFVYALSLSDARKLWALDRGPTPAVKAPGMAYGSQVIHGVRLYLATCNLEDRPGKATNFVVYIGEK